MIFAILVIGVVGMLLDHLLRPGSRLAISGVRRGHDQHLPPSKA
jgi:ABC-type nitrate/sulfonate/bicarbonate transport system permease component